MAAERENELRRAIEAGDFERVQPLVIEFATALRNKLSLAATLEERKAALRTGLDTLNAHLRLARAMRSHICARLEALAGHSSYQVGRRDTHTWRLEG